VAVLKGSFFAEASDDKPARLDVKVDEHSFAIGRNCPCDSARAASLEVFVAA
jgi:hypothetical protein